MALSDAMNSGDVDMIEKACELAEQVDLLTPGGDHASAGEEWRVISGRVLVSFSTDRAADLGPVLAVAAGLYHTAAVKVDGTLV